jgi:hypothetical protein
MIQPLSMDGWREQETMETMETIRLMSPFLC